MPIPFLGGSAQMTVSEVHRFVLKSNSPHFKRHFSYRSLTDLSIVCVFTCLSITIQQPKSHHGRVSTFNHLNGYSIPKPTTEQLAVKDYTDEVLCGNFYLK